MACENVLIYFMSLAMEVVAEAFKPTPAPAPVAQVKSRRRGRRPYHEFVGRDRTRPMEVFVNVRLSHDPSYYSVRSGLTPTRGTPISRFGPGLNPVHSQPTSLPGSANRKFLEFADPANPDSGPARPWPEPDA